MPGQLDPKLLSSELLHHPEEVLLPGVLGNSLPLNLDKATGMKETIETDFILQVLTL